MFIKNDYEYKYLYNFILRLTSTMKGIFERKIIDCIAYIVFFLSFSLHQLQQVSANANAFPLQLIPFSGGERAHGESHRWWRSSPRQRISQMV
jgi:hypothetical protein